MKRLIFYHKSDLDGKCSGAVASYFFKEEEHTLYPLEYYDDLPLEEMDSSSVLYFLDIFPQPYEERYEAFLERGVLPDNIFVCDHHKTFLESEVAGKVGGNSQIGLSGCELTFMFLYNKEYEEIPYWVKLLGRYDVWDNKDKEKWEEVILPFQWGMRQQNTDIAYGGVWNDLVYNRIDIKTIIEVGKEFLEKEKEANIDIMEKHSFTALFKGHKCLACNTYKYSSQIFESKWDPSLYDFMMPFSITNEGKVKASLYTDREDIDVSVIAKELGGGGHKGASGFIVDIYTFIENLIT